MRPASYVDDGHLTHGYAMTVHKSQGRPATFRSCSATTASTPRPATRRTRGRLRNHIYAVEAPDPNNPTAEIHRALARSAAKQTAIELGSRGL